MEAIAGITATVKTAEAAPAPRLIRAAHEFEAQLMKELLAPLIGSGDEEYSEGGSWGALAGFGGEVLGQALSRQGGFGIASSILRSLSQSSNVQPSDPALGRSSDGLKSGIQVKEATADKLGKEDCAWRSATMQRP
jgi:hypothetical protein